MPAAARSEFRDLIATGHLCDAIAPIQGALQFKVRIDGSLAAVTGDVIAPHTIKAGKVCVPHLATVIATSSRVFINGLNVARIGDPADLGVIITGSPRVFIGS
jgi:uncharacterized Zn-binding protein involved in type VI secretion